MEQPAFFSADAPQAPPSALPWKIDNSTYELNRLIHEANKSEVAEMCLCIVGIDDIEFDVEQVVELRGKSEKERARFMLAIVKEVKGFASFKFSPTSVCSTILI